MMPLNFTFRRLLLKYNPQLTNAEINRYESLVALYAQRKYDLKMVQTPGNDKREQITSNAYDEEDSLKKIHDEAQAIIAPVKSNYDKTYLLWNASREFALAQSNFLQIPHTIHGVRQYFKKFLNYRWIQIKTLPFLWYNKLITKK